MQSESDKSLSPPNASAVLNSTPKTFAQPIASYSSIRNKAVTKQKRNEKQQLFYHMEEIVDIQASITKV
jgi:hypothetical protein